LFVTYEQILRCPHPSGLHTQKHFKALHTETGSENVRFEMLKNLTLKGIVHPKIKIKSSFKLCGVVLIYRIFLLWTTKGE